MNALLVFQSLRPSGKEQISFCIENPARILQCSKLDEVEPLLQEAEQQARRGKFVAGFVTYEAGAAFLPGIRPATPGFLPLAWFAVADEVTAIPEPGTGEEPSIENLVLNVSPEEYRRAISRIKEHIARGDTYQVNFTARYRSLFSGSPRNLYKALYPRQRVNYAALIETDDWAVVSLSPELFFRKEGDRIEMRPMKGTIARGRTLQEDEEQARALRESAKELSENLMIVDMIRSDLGKLCKAGSIHVTSAMLVERYETLLQMTTTIEGQLEAFCGVPDIFRATFPSGSVTGAPKIRTMQIIESLETSPRGVYTGAVGYLHGADSVFNVAIRTVAIDLRAQTLEMGVGSGILYEADADREYRECELKAKFLTEPYQPFELFETLLWTPESGFTRADLHLDRMLQSAEYFLYPVSRESLLNLLTQSEPELRLSAEPQRVRILLNAEGSLTLLYSALDPLPEPLTVTLASQNTDSSDRFLFHKTTRRDLYEQELKAARQQGCFDVIFRNEKNEITEGAISNIFIRKGDLYLTPPVDCGLLAGTYRRHMLESQQYNVREQILTLQNLLTADQIFLTNALRGLIAVRLQ